MYVTEHQLKTLADLGTDVDLVEFPSTVAGDIEARVFSSHPERWIHESLIVRADGVVISRIEEES